MMKIISINGTDNTGKTTHAKLLTLKNGYNTALIGSISKYNSKWQTDANQKEWRTNNHNEEEFISLFIDSILERNRTIENLNGVDIAILDRGLIMLESTIIANLQLKKRISKEGAKDLFDSFVLKHYGRIDNKEDLSILLRYSDNINDNVDYTIFNQHGDFSDKENERYKIYQRHLNERLAENLSKFNSLIKADGPIIVTQNTIREIINEKFEYSIQSFGENITTIYGVGGSSEAGKSSFGEISRKKHDFLNLKIKYFSQIVKERYPDLSSESEEFNLYMIAEIEKFADAHYYIKKYSLESLHHPESVIFLKRFFGDRFKSIFIDADRDIRIKRYAHDNNIDINEATQKVSDKDEMKKNEGAFEIKKISDLVLNNNGSFARWKQKIANFHVLGEYEKNNSYEILDLSNLGLPEEYISTLEKVIDICKNEFKEALRLLVLSGSAGRQDVVPGFSDLDLFLVTDSTNSYKIKDFKSKYRFFDNIKVGYTFVDSTTVKKSVFDGKVSYIFRNIYNGEFPMLYGNNIKIPQINMDEEINLRKKEVFLYIDDTEEEIKNVVTDHGMLESIKHIHTIMKMLLLIYGVQKEGYRSVHDAFYEIFKKFSFIHVPCVIDILGEDQIKEKYVSDLAEFIKNLKISLEELINMS